MYLTNLSNAATDTVRPQLPADRADDILQYLETDTLRFRVEEPDHLVQFQAKAWDPVVKWVEERHGVNISWTSSIVADPLSHETKDIIKRHLMSYDAWSLLGCSADKFIISFLSN